ncbi:MAG: SUF system Fe-S cluster assembly protein [Planctomycetota bacterium]
MTAEAAKEGFSPLEEKVVETLKTVYDPEIPVDIYELGLIYDLAVSPRGEVEVKMTLTSPACPVAGTLPGEVETRIRGVKGVKSVVVELTWEPPWGPDRMSEAARLQLGL